MAFELPWSPQRVELAACWFGLRMLRGRFLALPGTASAKAGQLPSGREEEQGRKSVTE